MVESEENFNGTQDVDVETCKGVLEEKKRFLGVRKMGNRWQARVRHPKLKFEVHLGCYSSPEEAAVVVKKKKAEFEDMFKGEDSMNVESFRDEYQGRKYPPGVYRRGYERWGARMWHPVLKKDVSLGSYKTVEAAAAVVSKKRAELQELYGWRSMRARVISDCEDDKFAVQPNGTAEASVVSVENNMADFWMVHGWRKRVKLDSKDEDKVLQKPESEIISISECSHEQTGNEKVPAGVRKLKSGEWGVRIIDPMSRARTWLGLYDTAEGAVTFNKKKAALSAKRNEAEFDQCEFRYKEMSNSEAKCEFDPTLVLHAGRIDGIAADDKSKYGATDFLIRPEFNSVDSSRASVSEPEKLRSADVSEKFVLSNENWQEIECASDFDEAVRLGFIDEYGHLLGKYSELDEQMRFTTS